MQEDNLFCAPSFWKITYLLVFTLGTIQWPTNIHQFIFIIQSLAQHLVVVFMFH